MRISDTNPGTTRAISLRPQQPPEMERCYRSSDTAIGERAERSVAITGQRHADAKCSSEVELISAAQSGVSSALEELLMRHRTLVYRIARRLSGNAQEAEDLTQETMLRAFKNIRRFRKEAQFSSWLVAIVTNAAISIKRKENRVRWLFVDEPTHSEGLLSAENLPDTRRDPEQDFLCNELRHLVQQAIAKQKPKSQAILLACELDELSLKQAAGSLGITPAAAKSQLVRARRRLSRTIRGRVGFRDSREWAKQLKQAEVVRASVPERLPKLHSFTPPVCVARSTERFDVVE